VSTGRDDDALTWDGDDDPTLDAGGEPAATPPVLPAGYTAVGRGSSRAKEPRPTRDRRGDAADAEPTPMGNAALVGVGMVAAAFLLFAVGWLVVSFRLQSVDGLPVPAVALAIITLAAAAAPLIWFVTVYALTRRSKTWVRFAWLLAGVVLLVPWPFLATGVFG
jgi:hypothetical protein